MPSRFSKRSKYFGPKKAIRAYDKKFDAWCAKVTEYMWGSGTLPTDPQVKEFDPYGAFDAGQTWREFVLDVDKALGHPQGFTDSAAYERSKR